MSELKQVDKVDFQHAAYKANIGLWSKCRTVAAGEEAVKAAGARFLRRLGNQDDEAYESYKDRALFYEATGRTVQGMVGALCGREPELVGPKSKESFEFFSDIFPYSVPVKTFLRQVAEEVIITGRCGVLVDASADGGDPYLSLWQAEDIINWRSAFVDGRDTVVMVVLREPYSEHGTYAAEEKTRYRVLRLVPDGDGLVYEQQVFAKLKPEDENYSPIGEPMRPTSGGKTMAVIPFYFINAGGTTPDVERPPINSLVNTNVSHYKTSADLEHGRHFTGLPTAWIAGFPESEDKKFVIGSHVAWVSSDVNAKAGFLEFTGQGLSELRLASDEKAGYMSILGARLLEAPRKQSESADNQKIKRSGESNILAGIADAISEGMTLAAKFCAEWRGLNGHEDVKIELQKEYMTREPNAQLLGQLTTMLQGGAISWETYWQALREQGIAREGVSAEEEKDAIDNGEFGSSGPSIDGGAQLPPPDPGGPGGERGNKGGSEDRAGADSEGSGTPPFGAPPPALSQGAPMPIIEKTMTAAEYAAYRERREKEDAALDARLARFGLTGKEGVVLPSDPNVAPYSAVDDD